MNQVLTDMLDSAGADYVGINRTDARALDVIDQRGRITAGDLARELRMSTGAVTAIVDRLERVDYARRVPDPDDRRRVLIEVTPIVGEQSARIYGTADDVTKALSAYTDEELELLIAFQQATRAWLEERLENLANLRATARPGRR